MAQKYPKSRFSIPAEVWSFFLGGVFGDPIASKHKVFGSVGLKWFQTQRGLYIFLWGTSMAKCSCSMMSQVCKGISYDPFLDGVNNMQS